jgi:hypothetical protein
VVTEPEGSAPLIRKPSTGHDPEPVPPTSHIHLHVIFASLSWSSKWLLSKTSRQQNSVYNFLPHSRLVDFTIPTVS